MSYILDALRRADAERERGSVPGIHAQPAMLGHADAEMQRPPRTNLWIGLALGSALMALLGWLLLGQDTPPPAAPAAAAPPLAITVLPVAPATVAEPSSTVTPNTAPAVTPAPAPVALTTPPAVTQAPRKPSPRLPVNTAEGAMPVASSPVASAAVPPSTEPRVYAFNELPEEIRRELPTLVIGGAMYSKNPSNRMLILNGQTLHEGDKLVPGLKLEQISLKSAVLEYKGYRYGIKY